MERDLEFEGKDVEEALGRAEAALGRKPGAQEYQVLEDGKKGFLGFGTRRARVRLLGATRTDPADAEPQSSFPTAPLLRRPGGGQAQTAPDASHGALKEVAGRILRAMDLQLTAKLRDRDEAIVLELGGRDARYLLEHDGEGIEALQHLLNKILSRDPRFGRRVIVDCEGFRGRRDGELVEKAARAADEVRKTGKSAHFDGLNPYERRLVHLALAAERGVRTYSTGKGGGKRLIIEADAGPAPATGAGREV